MKNLLAALWQRRQLPKTASAETITILTREPSVSQCSLTIVKVLLRQWWHDLFDQQSRVKHRMERQTLQAHIAALEAGLASVGIPFQRNPIASRVTKSVLIMSSLPALRWAINAKKAGRITKLVVSSSVVSSPDEDNRIISDPAIDAVLIGSPWQQNWWATFDQRFLSSPVWVCGVADRGESRIPQGLCIVYAKNADQKIFRATIDALWRHKLPIVVSNYGSFSQSEYLRLLRQARCLVQISGAETDGLSLRQAWMANIPTLIYSNASIVGGTGTFTDSTIGAPFFDPACGMLFGSAAEVEPALADFLAQLDTFEPRTYALAKFDLRTSARNLAGFFAGTKSTVY